jgi:hypothetical protein
MRGVFAAVSGSFPNHAGLADFIKRATSYVPRTKEDLF